MRKQQEKEEGQSKQRSLFVMALREAVRALEAPMAKLGIEDIRIRDAAGSAASMQECVVAPPLLFFCVSVGVCLSGCVCLCVLFWFFGFFDT